MTLTIDDWVIAKARSPLRRGRKVPEPLRLTPPSFSLVSPQCEVQRIYIEAVLHLAAQHAAAVGDCLTAQNLSRELPFPGVGKAMLPEAHWTLRTELNLVLP